MTNHSHEALHPGTAVTANATPGHVAYHDHAQGVVWVYTREGLRAYAPRTVRLRDCGNEGGERGQGPQQAGYGMRNTGPTCVTPRGRSPTPLLRLIAA